MTFFYPSLRRSRDTVLPPICFTSTSNNTTTTTATATAQSRNKFNNSNNAAQDNSNQLIFAAKIPLPSTPADSTKGTTEIKKMQGQIKNL